MHGCILMRRGVLLSALFALILCAVPAPSQGRPYVIKGQVVDPQGLPVAEATLTLRNTLSGKSQQQRTSSNGHYSFHLIEPGFYTLIASHGGFSDQVRFLQLKPEYLLLTEDIRLPVAGVRQDVTVVSGSRVEELQQDSPSPVTVVTHQQIIDTGKETVGGVLSEVPGVITRDYDTYEQGFADEQIDGIDSRQVLVLEDGLPIVGARGVNSGVINLNDQPVGPLDQIEVAKGAGSALYGTDAIGGVINLITRKPTSPLDADLNFSGGSLGVFDGSGSVGSEVRNGWVLADFERHQGDSYSLIPPSTTGPQYGIYDGFFDGSYDLGKRTSLDFRAGGYHDHDVGQGETETGLSQSNDTASNQSFALTGNFQLAPSSVLQVRGYIANYNEGDLTVPIGASTASPDVTDLATLGERYHRMDATWSQTLGAHQFLQGGYEWVQDLYKGNNRLLGGDAGQQITTNDLWAQDRIQLASPLLLTIGVRYQHHSLYGSHTVPKIGLSYRIANLHYS
jgi:outer membrane receptor for ferrienterochelin and colicins